MKEYILCSAIWYMDWETPASHQPRNIEKGVVVCGLGHANCIGTMYSLTKKRTVTNAEDGVGEYIQGFLTSKNRFVDREEAMVIAKEADQVSETYDKKILYSEDLFSPINNKNLNKK